MLIGRIPGDCVHGDDPRWCVLCLRVEVANMRTLLDDANKEIARLCTELEQQPTRDSWGPLDHE